MCLTISRRFVHSRNCFKFARLCQICAFIFAISAKRDPSLCDIQESIYVKTLKSKLLEYITYILTSWVYRVTHKGLILQRRLYGIYIVFFLKFMTPCYKELASLFTKFDFFSPGLRFYWN